MLIALRTLLETIAIVFSFGIIGVIGVIAVFCMIERKEEQDADK